jgi:hypothetical protein
MILKDILAMPIEPEPPGGPPLAPFPTHLVGQLHELVLIQADALARIRTIQHDPETYLATEKQRLQTQFLDVTSRAHELTSAMVDWVLGCEAQLQGQRVAAEAGAETPPRPHEDDPDDDEDPGTSGIPAGRF